MKTLLKSLAIVLSLIAGSRAMEETMDVENTEIIPYLQIMPAEYVCPDEINALILADVAFENCYKFGCVYNLACINRAWHHFFKAQNPSNLSYYRAPYNMEEFCLYELWRHAKLTYKKMDNTTVDLPFSVFPNSLTGKLDLSDCEDADKYLSISPWISHSL